MIMIIIKYYLITMSLWGDTRILYPFLNHQEALRKTSDQYYLY